MANDGSENDKTLANIEGALKSLPDDMIKFSICLRSLYIEKNVDSSSVPSSEDLDVREKFLELRDETRNDAMIYYSCVLPFSKKVVSAIDDYYDYYQGLDFKNWSTFLPDIVEETRGYRRLCEITIKMHEDMLVALKPRKDKAHEILLKLPALQREYEQKVKDLEDSAATRRGWAIGLAFIPFVNIFASPILGALARQDQAKAIATSEQANVQEAAALIVEEELIPALKAFIKGLETVAGFFSVIENKLQQFIDKGEKGSMRVHYMMMKRKAKEIRSNCERFMLAIPAVTTNFASIPKEGTDRNYIDIWLKKQKKLIKKQRNAEVKKIFWKVLKDLAQAI